MQHKKGNPVLIQRTQDLTSGKCTRRTIVSAKTLRNHQSILLRFSFKNPISISHIQVPLI